MNYNVLHIGRCNEIRLKLVPLVLVLLVGMRQMISVRIMFVCIVRYLKPIADVQV